MRNPPSWRFCNFVWRLPLSAIWAFSKIRYKIKTFQEAKILLINYLMQKEVPLQLHCTATDFCRIFQQLVFSVDSTLHHGCFATYFSVSQSQKWTKEQKTQKRRRFGIHTGAVHRSKLVSVSLVFNRKEEDCIRHFFYKRTWHNT